MNDDDSLWSKFVRRFNRRDVGNPFAKLYNDIMFNIFGRLLADTLLACKLVSPCWYGLITSTNLVDNTYLNHQGTKKLAFFIAKSPQGIQMVVIEDVYIKKTINLNLDNTISFGYTNTDLFVVGSCNGLILISCLTLSESPPLMIYNPIIKEVVLLRESMSSSTGPFGNRNIFACGIVFHELTNEYNIILGKVSKVLTQNVSKVTYYLYGLKTKLWKTLLLNCPYVTDSKTPSVNLSDMVCWSVNRRQGSMLIFGVMVYNLTNQTLQIIPHPLHNVNLDPYVSISSKQYIIRPCVNCR